MTSLASYKNRHFRPMLIYRNMFICLLFGSLHASVYVYDVLFLPTPVMTPVL